MAEDLCKLDHQNQVIVDHSIQLLLASQTLHDQKIAHPPRTTSRLKKEVK